MESSLRVGGLSVAQARALEPALQAGLAAALGAALGTRVHVLITGHAAGAPRLLKSHVRRDVEAV